MNTKNLNQFVDDFRELERKIECGYIPDNVAYKLDIFARAELPSGSNVGLLSSFNNLSPFLDIPTNLYLASDNAADTFEVLIDYIDQNRDRKNITVNLTGTTPINLNTLFNSDGELFDAYCIFRVFNNSNIDQVGTRVVITNNVSGVPVDDSEVFNEMIVTSSLPANISLSSFFSIPNGYTGFITKAYITADKNSDVKGALFIRPENQVFKFIKALETFQQQSISLDMFDRVKEKTDLKPVGVAPTGGGLTYVDYTIIVINNDYLNKHTQG